MKTHQNENEDLPQEAILNNPVNDAAYEYYDTESCMEQSTRPVEFSAQLITIYQSGTTLISNIKTTLVKNEMRGEIDDYYEERFAIHPTIMNQIEWRSFCRIFKRNKNIKHKFAKLIHRQYNTMLTCHKWKTSKTVVCPLCTTNIEDDDHIYSCHHVDTIRVGEKSIKKVKDKLYALESKPDLTKTILYLSQNWNTSPE